MDDWMKDADCQDLPTEVFFIDGVGAGNSHENQMVKKVCEGCGVREQCLNTALRLERFSGKNRYGVWGGLAPRQRLQLWLEMKSTFQDQDDFCKHGHVMDEANTYFNPGGYRQCRKCKERQRSEWAVRKNLVS